MAKRVNKPVKTCADCIHEYACGMWNIGYIHNMDATNCTNHETVKESAAYLIGRMDEQKKGTAMDELIQLRDDLYDADAITMKGIKLLNELIFKNIGSVDNA